MKVRNFMILGEVFNFALSYLVVCNYQLLCFKNGSLETTIKI